MDILLDNAIYGICLQSPFVQKETAFDDFENYLKSKHIVRNDHIPYYMSWIRNCLATAGKNNGNELSQTEIQSYIKNLSKKKEDWQVEQAADAIRIYQFYVKQQAIPFPDSSHSADDQWRHAAEEMVRMLRLKKLARTTENKYLRWLRSFYRFLNGLSPLQLDSTHVKNFLTQMAVEKNVSKSTQNQAFNAILFFFRHVLEKDINDIQDVVRARRRKNLPVVLTKEEIIRLFQELRGEYLLMSQLIYGGGLRLRECVNLRIKDIDFDRNCINVIAGKGDKDRQTVLSESIKESLRKHIKKIHPLFLQDRENNVPGVELPYALERKYPNAGKEWIWQWLFPAGFLSLDPQTKLVRRWHIYPSTLQKHLRRVAVKAGLSKRVTVHCLRHSFATHLIEDGCDIRTVQELLGHSNLQTTMIYTHVAKKNMLGVKSPLDSI